MKKLLLTLLALLFCYIPAAFGTQELKQSTQIKVRVGPFVDVTDGYTPETGITLGAADEAELLKYNGAGTVDISSNTWAAVTGCDGWYDLTLTTSDTDTLGDITIVVQDDSTCLPVFATFSITTANYWDSKYSTDKFDVSVAQWNGTNVGTPDTAGYPVVTIKNGTGSGEIATTSGAIDDVTLVGTTTTNTDMRGTDSAFLAASAPTNFSDLAITSSTGKITVGTNDDKTGYSISGSITTLDGLNNFDPSSDAVANVTLVDTCTSNTDMRGTDNAVTASTAFVSVIPFIPRSIDVADTATYRIGLGLIDPLDDLPSTGEITPGTITIDRKAPGATSWTNVVNGAACSEAAGIAYYDEVFDATTGYRSGDMIRITFKNVAVVIGGNTVEIAGSTGLVFTTTIRSF